VSSAPSIRRAQRLVAVAGFERKKGPAGLEPLGWVGDCFQAGITQSIRAEQVRKSGGFQRLMAGGPKGLGPIPSKQGSGQGNSAASPGALFPMVQGQDRLLFLVRPVDAQAIVGTAPCGKGERLWNHSGLGRFAGWISGLLARGPGWAKPFARPGCNRFAPVLRALVFSPAKQTQSSPPEQGPMAPRPIQWPGTAPWDRKTPRTCQARPKNQTALIAVPSGVARRSRPVDDKPL